MFKQHFRAFIDEESTQRCSVDFCHINPLLVIGYTEVNITPPRIALDILFIESYFFCGHVYISNPAEVKPLIIGRKHGHLPVTLCDE